MKYKKTFSELENVAIKWWPKSLEDQVATQSVVPLLVQTQEKFIAVLQLSGESPTQVFEILGTEALSANLFLKHLVVLSDFGGEPIKRLGSEFKKIFKLDKKTERYGFEFSFKGELKRYSFESLPVVGLSNARLGIDGKSIVEKHPLDGLYRDIIMLLLHGSTSEVSGFAGLERCDLGGLLGDPTALGQYIRQRYIHVSRITTGATANGLGQIAQIYVADFLSQALGEDYIVQSNGRVHLKGYDSKDGMPFDVVIGRGKRKVGVEVSFQVTSNSVIERKAAQAENRRNLMNREGNHIAYVLDGAGNFSRSAAVTVICQSSDCTVAFSESELSVLVDFVRGKLDD